MDESDREPPVGITARPRRKPSYRGRSVILIVLSVLFLGVTLFDPDWLRHPITLWADPPSHVRYIDPKQAFTLRFPKAWHANTSWDTSSSGVYDLEHRGIFLSNIVVPEIGFDSENVPAGVVAVSVAYSYGGGFTGRCHYDRPLPLTLKDATRFDYATFADTVLRDNQGAEIKHFTLNFSVEGVPLYIVAAWIGSRASPQDLRILDEIVASIHYDSSLQAPQGVAQPCRGA